MITMRKLSLS
ncbi:succinate dehydrogenase and fumarate reductase iron-sulfur family protein, partial [Vibrio parahaemolyticus V-223/04]